MDPENDPLALSPNDRDLMIRTVIGEAGNDPSAQGVAAVIANRMWQTGQSAGQIVLAPGQFEAWSKPAQLMKYSPTDPAYRAAAQIVDAAVSSKTPDPTGGATQFYAPDAQKALGRQPPAWDDGTGQRIGSQLFFGGQQSDPLAGFEIAPGAKSAAAPADDPLAGFEIAPSKAAKAASSAPAAAAPAASSAPDDPLAGFNVAPAAPAAAAAAPDVPADRPPNLPHAFTPTEALRAAMTAKPTTVDPYDPILTQLKSALGGAGSYLAGQVSGLPSAITSDFSAGRSALASGLDQIWKGNWDTSVKGAPPAPPQLVDRGERDLFGNPVLHSTAEFPNNLAVNPGGALTALGGAAQMLTSPLTGATRQFVEDPVTQASGSPDIGARAGLVASSLAGPLAGRVVGGAGSALADSLIGKIDPARAALAATARDKFGIPIGTGQLSENPLVNVLNSTVDSLPGSGGAAAKTTIQTAWDRGVASTIGETADRVTPEVLARARTRIGAVFDDVANKTNINVDPQLQNQLQTTMLDASRGLTDSEFRVVSNAFDDLMGKIGPDGTIAGKDYQNLVKSNTFFNKTLNNGNSNISNAVEEMKDALDDAMGRSAPPEVQAAYATAKDQWRNLKTIDPLVAKSQTGAISPPLLANAINSSRYSRNALAYPGGAGDLGDLARIGQAFLKEPANSNTAQRALSFGALADAGTALAALPFSLTAGRAAGSVLHSNWLANDLINRSLQLRSPGPLQRAAGVLGTQTPQWPSLSAGSALSNVLAGSGNKAINSALSPVGAQNP
jgi:hypothetical protein